MRRDASEAGAAILEVKGLTKAFGNSLALSRVDFSVGRHQVIGVVGENGAGKSTLLNILSGILPPDAGEILLHGRPVALRGYDQAAAVGISRVFQEQALIPNIRVYENLLLSQEGRFVRWRQLMRKGEMIALAQDMIDDAGVDLDVRRVTADCSFSKRQLLEIVRACLIPLRVLEIDHPIILLDEPTASLEKADEEVFFRLLERMRQAASLIFVSHRLTEVLAYSDRITVFKDGEVVANLDPRSADERRLHALMVGRERDADYYHEAEQGDADASRVVFRTRGLGRDGVYADVDLAVRAGEILGISGLLNSGTASFGKGAAGVAAPTRGEVQVDGGPWQAPDIRRLVAQGVGYVPAERLAEGMIAGFSVAWNLSLANGDQFSDRFGIWQARKETEVTERFIRRLNIKARSATALCTTLSGGNQQKVVLARWLCRDLKVLILDNPTRGVDAGAKEEIYGLIRRLTASGVAIVLITDELLELIGLSHRIAIMQHGRVTSLVEARVGAKPSEQLLIELMLTPKSDGKDLAA